MGEKNLYKSFSVATILVVFSAFLAVFFNVQLDLFALLCGVSYSLLSLVFYIKLVSICSGVGGKKLFLSVLGGVKVGLLIMLFLYASQVQVAWLLSALAGYFTLLPTALIAAWQGTSSTGDS